MTFLIKLMTIFGPGMAPAPAVAACGPILGPTRNAAPEMVLAGGLGGALETGCPPNYMNAGAYNRKMCSLYLSLMDRFGVKLEQFGDARERLVGL
jgi:hypothetical protein